MVTGAVDSISTTAAGSVATTAIVSVSVSVQVAVADSLWVVTPKVDRGAKAAVDDADDTKMATASDRRIIQA